MNPAGPRAEEGFSTIETLVAFVILAMGLGLAVQSLAQSRLLLVHSRGEQAASALARRVTAEELPGLLRSAPEAGLVRSGDGWQVVIEPAAPGRNRRVVIRTGRRADGSFARSSVAVLPGRRGEGG